MIDLLAPLSAIAALTSGVLWFHDWLKARELRRQIKHLIRENELLEAQGESLETSLRTQLYYQRLLHEEAEDHDRRTKRIWFGDEPWRDGGESWK